MKKAVAWMLMAVLTIGMLTGCQKEEVPGTEFGSGAMGDPNLPGGPGNGQPGSDGAGSSATDQNFGETLENLGVYEGYFEEETTEVQVTWVSGTEGAYQLKGNVLTFYGISEDSVYEISGRLKGNIVIDVNEDYKLELVMKGFSLVSEKTSPIQILGGDKVTLTAKKETKNYIYDIRPSIDENDDSLHSGAIYATCDLKIGGKGSLFVVSEENNGIHTKDDLEVKNLTLLVSCVDNALKGNDSVTLTDCNTTLIATEGDGIKTKNTDISSKGKQRGIVTITGGKHEIYAGKDGIDAAYDVVIDEETTEVSIYTASFSAHTKKEEEKTATETAVSVASFGGGRPERPDGDGQEGGKRPGMGTDPGAGGTPGGEMDPGQGGFGGGRPGGMGGFGGSMDGNPNKSDVSQKGLKAGNEVRITRGQITIYAYDDAIHANGGETLENGAASTGNVMISGGSLQLVSKDDGIHGDGRVQISGGTIIVSESYEGIEGAQVEISGGNIAVASFDDGINGTATSGTAITISGGSIYVYASGDGLDSNSRSSYEGILFSGGNSVIFTNGTADSAIDTEQGYVYTGGIHIAIMSSRGMTSEVTHCSNFNSVATKSILSLSAGECLTVTTKEAVTTIRMNEKLQAMVVCLGDTDAKMDTASETGKTLDANGILWEMSAK